MIYAVKNIFKIEHFVKGKTLFKTSNHNKFFKNKISDNGVGIRQKVKERVREPFLLQKKSVLVLVIA